jgi:predicted nucleotidyltransferase
MKARGPAQSAALLLDLAAIMESRGVEYVVIGATAASVHGPVRATMDADALVSIGIAKLKQLQKEFKRAGLSADVRQGDAEDPIAALLAVSDKHGNRVDILTGLRGLDSNAFSRAIEVPLYGSSLRVVGREDFIAMKCFAGSQQDIADARNVLKAAKQPIDIDLVRRLTMRFGKSAANVLEQVLKF